MRTTKNEYRTYRRLLTKLTKWRRYEKNARPLTAKEDHQYFRLVAIYG